MKNRFYTYIQKLQNEITLALEGVDGKARFKEDVWTRSEGGGGQSRILENGAVIEKGGVNISAVHGPLPKSMQSYFKVGDVNFYACGLSLVLHPKNPMAPTVHANWRYFEMYDKSNTLIDQWFGGGLDLTPYYLFEEDAIHWHEVASKACKPFGDKVYERYKKWCDDYFYLSHRNEQRGIGGLFFDDLNEGGFDSCFEFMKSIGNHFIEAYKPIVLRRQGMPYTDKQKEFQLYRRGRYVEFNLVQDRGTLFGLQSGGRTESILMSLPPNVNWVYQFNIESKSEEEKLMNYFLKPRDWIS